MLRDSNTNTRGDFQDKGNAPKLFDVCGRSFAFQVNFPFQVIHKGLRVHHEFLRLCSSLKENTFSRHGKLWCVNALLDSCIDALVP